jgi:hypothetical protein
MTTEDDTRPQPEAAVPPAKPPSQSVRPLPPALPASIDDWTRFLKQERTINDMVEDIHRTLVNESQKYRDYLRAVWDEQAVEGSLSADNYEAATMIRDKAKTIGSEVANEKKATIVKALNVVLRRYHASRKQRRHMVAGEEVPADTNGE